MKAEHGLRRAIIREWMTLPPEKRRTTEQAAAFATKTIDSHKFGSGGDPRARVLAWLSPRIDRA